MRNIPRLWNWIELSISWGFMVNVQTFTIKPQLIENSIMIITNSDCYVTQSFSCLLLAICIKVFLFILYFKQHCLFCCHFLIFRVEHYFPFPSYLIIQKYTPCYADVFTCFCTKNIPNFLIIMLVGNVPYCTAFLYVFKFKQQAFVLLKPSQVVLKFWKL